MVQVYKNIPNSPKAACGCAQAIDDLLNPELFKALGDATRLQLLACLAKCRRPCSVSEIAECCSVDLSVVSRHLKILEDAELIQSKKEGRTVWYQAQGEKLIGVFREISKGFAECCGVVQGKHPRKTNSSTGCCR